MKLNRSYSLVKLFAALSCLVGFFAHAAVPLKWSVETSRLQPVVFEAVHGETLALEASFSSYGIPFEMSEKPCSIYYQTNGMDSAWWKASATAVSNRVSALFTPQMDPGNATVHGFIGSTGDLYRAAFTIRFRPGPGAIPNEIPLPTKYLDLAAVELLNIESAPWETTESVDIKDAATLAAATNAIAAKADRSELLVYRTTNDYAVSQTVYSPWIITNAQGGVVTGYTVGRITGPKRFWALYSGDSLYNVSPNYDDNAFYVTFPTVGLSMSRILAARSGDTLAGISLVTNKADRATTLAGYGITDGSTIDDLAGKADIETVNDLSVAVNEANAWAMGTFNFMSGNTNAWFAGTNYVTGADITNKMHFAFEDGMDLLTMPCSMALWENRDGQRGCVWDQRDWVAWYWTFKAQQMMAQVAASNDVIRAEIASDANHAWAKHYASSGRVNPDSSTTYIDTKRVCLSPGMAWETVAEVNGAAYWTIVGNGAVFGGSGTNAILEIKDFEGNAIMTVTKGEHQLVGLLQESFTNDGPRYDADGWACFEILANVQPVGYFSVTPYAEDFVAETSSDCPALFRWEQITAPSQGVSGKWRIHYLLKPEIIANACFAKFLVEVQGQTQVKYTAGMNIEGGLIYGGKKIVPVIPVGAQAGDTITWKVVQ